jgi:dTDP-4-dehydrorhamnose reductase
MERVLILGENGMLGDAVRRYFRELPAYELVSVSERWPGQSFKDAVMAADADVIINCIGKIPQRHPSEDEYLETNVDLPAFLETLDIRVIHPSTDCEFSGNLPVGSLYTKSSPRDAEDAYGRSKAIISERIETTFKNTKTIRTSIIGHERSSNVSLLDWFLSSEGTVKGYTNHYWNGITTLMWAELAKDLIEAWEDSPVLNQYGTSEVASKYAVLHIIKDIYVKDVRIEAFDAPQTVNKCLASDIEIPNLAEQLEALKSFYKSS